VCLFVRAGVYTPAYHKMEIFQEKKLFFDAGHSLLGACIINHYLFVTYRLNGKLVCLFVRAGVYTPAYHKMEIFQEKKTFF
jgi:hypothetical protein